MAYLKNWTDNLFQMFFMGTSWVAVSINYIKTRASREMTSRKNIIFFDFNSMNVAKHWNRAGDVFAISDCLIQFVANRIIWATFSGDPHTILHQRRPFSETKLRLFVVRGMNNCGMSPFGSDFNKYSGTFCKING